MYRVNLNECIKHWWIEILITVCIFWLIIMVYIDINKINDKFKLSIVCENYASYTIEFDINDAEITDDKVEVSKWWFLPPRLFEKDKCRIKQVFYPTQ